NGRPAPGRGTWRGDARRGTAGRPLSLPARSSASLAGSCPAPSARPLPVEVLGVEGARPPPGAAVGPLVGDRPRLAAPRLRCPPLPLPVSVGFAHGMGLFFGRLQGAALRATADSPCWTVMEAGAAGSPAARAAFARRYGVVVRAYLAVRWRASPCLQDLD